MELLLAGKTALVTGASSGIGRGIAYALGAEGARLAITARRRERLEEVAAEIVARGGHRPIVIEQDFMQEDAPRKIAEAALAGLGTVQILVNNAGGSRAFKLQATEAQWEEALTLNFTRQRQLTDRLLAPMIEGRWGRIVNITGPGLSTPAPAAETMERMQNRIVVRYQDRRLVKGSTTDFLPTKDVFHLMSADNAAPTPLEVRLSEAKAVFFVKHLDGNPAYRDRKAFDPARPVVGRKIRVVFKDGELLIGTTQAYQPGRPGFFVIPADPGTNNERCFVVSSAVKHVAFI